MSTAHASPRESAELLVMQGKSLEQSRGELSALRRYTDALTIDPSCEAAYLALGDLRFRRNELHEAEDVFEQALLRVPASAGARFGRGRVRRARGHAALAAFDYRTGLEMLHHDASDLEMSLLKELVSLARERGHAAEELPGWRRLSAVARARGDELLLRDSVLQARTIARFLEDIDPVTSGLRGDDVVRRTLGAVGRRGG